MKGIIAPPETAMIISPDISLALSGYSFTVKEKINGKIFEADKPIKNIIICANKGEKEKIKSKAVKKVAIEEASKNFEDENRINRKVPIKVPNILPKK